MITVLVGHRGVGKSSLLKKISAKTGWQAIDLDVEIEKGERTDIRTVFLEKGEPAFRELEIKYFKELTAKIKKPLVIAVGAGFQGPLAQHHVVWVRRFTDQNPRYFVDRPIVKIDLDKREQHYRDISHEVLQLPEGYEDGHTGLEQFFLSELKTHLHADFTLFPRHLQDSFIQKRLDWGIRRFEVRTDLLDDVQRAWVLKRVPPEKILWSIRSSTTAPLGVTVDWAIELGEPPRGTQILSIHERRSTLEATVHGFATYPGAIAKLAIEIRSITELIEGHRWWMQDPRRRAFLPRSSDGRWQWYRSLFGPRMPVHFYREDEGSSLDQPFLWQHWMQPPVDKSFAAVLGFPIGHSRTPMEHLNFFNRRKLPVVAIPVQENEWQEALPILQTLGLRYAAVTAPLKKLAFLSVQQRDSEAQQTESVNTLLWQNKNWYGANTDVVGLDVLKKEVPGELNLGLWGGGGTQNSVRKIFPGIQSFSAREGSRLEQGPETLIWAVPRNRQAQIPPLSWNLKAIVDLNYTQDSPGLQIAMERGLSYVSGLPMFKAQAEAQRKFWQECEGKKK